MAALALPAIIGAAGVALVNIVEQFGKNKNLEDAAKLERQRNNNEYRLKQAGKLCENTSSFEMALLLVFLPICVNLTLIVKL